MKRDRGLTARMAFTILMLSFAYVALIIILFWAGISPYFIFGIGIVMVFFQYFMSDKLVLAATRSKVVTEKERPKLHSMIDRLSKAAGIPKPKYFKAAAVILIFSIVKDPYPNNAFTISSEAKIKPKLAGTDNKSESSIVLL